MVEQLTAKNFKEKISSGAVAVDFWAPWCGPCKMMAPEYEAAAEETSEVTFFKLNTEEGESIPEELGIRGIPTVIFFKDGKEVSRFSGLRKKEEIVTQTQKAFS